MNSRLRTMIVWMAMALNLAAVVLFIACSQVPQTSPYQWWIAGFLPLMLPYLMVLLLLSCLFWLFHRPYWSLIPAIALLLGMESIRMVMPLRLRSPFKAERDSSVLRVMDWNLRFMTPFKKVYYDNDIGSQQEKVFEEVGRYAPDILCLQEFTDVRPEGAKSPVDILKGRHGLRYHCFPGDDLKWNSVNSGTAIFSRYPIVASGIMPYPENIARDIEQTVFADIVLPSADTVRVFSLHLQSFGFLPRDYSAFGRISRQQDTGLTASKSLIRKMRTTFRMHGLQADHIAARIAESRYPVIVCTDMNDVPASYAYRRIKGDMKDAFIEKGAGFGNTYISPSSRLMGKLPTLRIDYILTDPRFETLQVTRGMQKLSDHIPLVADLRLSQKR